MLFIIFNVFAHVGAYGQTNIGRYTHGFTKTISVNHPQLAFFSCGHTAGLKTALLGSVSEIFTHKHGV